MALKVRQGGQWVEISSGGGSGGGGSTTGTLTLNTQRSTSGNSSLITGGQTSFNGSANSNFMVTLHASSSNTGNTVVHRDSSGNFQAQDVRVDSFGVGTNASGTSGEIRATNNITAYYSDERLKDILGTIDNPISKVLNLKGVYYKENQTAKDLGYDNNRVQVGVIAQDVEKVLPEAVTDAPIDAKYKTVWYEKLVPLLIEAIKEQQGTIEGLNSRLEHLEGIVDV